MNNYLLQKFCNKKTSRNHFTEKPFSYNGYTYASNGKILVRVKGEQSERPNTVPVLPSMEEIANYTDFIALPKFPKREEIACGECDGTGTISYRVCDNCNDGQVYLDDSHGNTYTVVCAECDGEGELNDPGGEKEECDCCEGTGISKRSYMDWGKELGKRYAGGISYHTHKLISTLKDIKVSDTWHDDGANEYAFFTFKDGDGLITIRRVSTSTPF